MSASQTPQTFSLEQNFPNPFNSSTQIRYSLREAGEMDLSLYNLTGQMVATLVEGRREAGSYAVSMDARDYASGVYLYRLRSGANVETRKLVLVR